MSVGPWITLVLAYGTLPCAAGAIAWAAPRVRREPVTEVCPRCGYSLQGLGAAENCPECGTPRSDMWRWARSPAAAIERLAVALIMPAITATVAASICLAMRPAQDVPVVTFIAAAPYVIPALTILIAYRREKLSFTLKFAATVAGLGNLLLAAVMVGYWTSPIDGGDYGWPVTNIALLSVLYGAAFLLACLGYGVARLGVRSGPGSAR